MLSLFKSIVSTPPTEQEAEEGQGQGQGQGHSNPSELRLEEPELAEDALQQEHLRQWREQVYDAIKGIADPEKPCTLEQLEVVKEELVEVTKRGISKINSRGGALQSEEDAFVASVGFVPTIPHCSLATLIGLCLRTKLERTLPVGVFKFDLYVVPGTHHTAEEITKQINDKERVAAAMENPSLRATVEQCIKDQE